jgi:hypothetical protein
MTVQQRAAIATIPTSEGNEIAMEKCLCGPGINYHKSFNSPVLKNKEKVKFIVLLSFFRQRTRAVFVRSK